MRSLWAGVTGLQAHQIAMDVEGNNIANVNTVGFKYSRANFDDLIYGAVRAETANQTLGHNAAHSEKDQEKLSGDRYAEDKENGSWWLYR